MLECKYAIEKIRVGAGIVRSVAIFNRMDSVGFIELVAFDPRLKRIERLSHMNFWRSGILDSPEAAEYSWEIQGIARMP